MSFGKWQLFCLNLNVLSEQMPHFVQAFSSILLLLMPSLHSGCPKTTSLYNAALRVQMENEQQFSATEFLEAMVPAAPNRVCVHSDVQFLYARLKNGRIMLWQCPSVCPSVRPSFPDFFSTCFEISIWNLVYAFSRSHDMSSLSFITIGSLWPSLQPKVGQTQFLQLWPYKSR